MQSSGQRPESPQTRVAIVYDCLYPHSVGGAERWYRALAERLGTSQGRYEVTYVTRRQWTGNDPGTSFRVRPVSPGGDLYTESGRRRIWPPIRFGIGVFAHLLRHGRDYDVVHSCSFPYFSLIGAWLALRLRRSRATLVVDWFEIWGRTYWHSYLGTIGGRIGHGVQSLCARLPDRSFAFSHMHAERLEAVGHHGPITRLTGAFQAPPGEGPTEPASAPSPPLVVFAGRHIPEKRVTTIPAAIAAALTELPDLRCVILGDGPQRDEVARKVAALGLEDAIEMPGFVSAEEVDKAIATASCLLLPSEREGYGLVVVEAVSLGTPAIVVAGPENAAVELIEPGVNGRVASSTEPAEIAAQISAVVRGGDPLRASALAWYREHAQRLSLEGSLVEVERAYGAKR